MISNVSFKLNLNFVLFAARKRKGTINSATSELYINFPVVIDTCSSFFLIQTTFAPTEKTSRRLRLYHFDLGYSSLVITMKKLRCT